MTAIWSEISIASSWSCVTKTVVTCTTSWSCAEPLAKLGADARVERAERLVEEQHLRLGGERAREPHALSLAARELRRVAVPEALELDEVQQLVDALARSRPSAACAPSGRTRCCPRTVMCLNAA